MRVKGAFIKPYSKPKRKRQASGDAPGDAKARGEQKPFYQRPVFAFAGWAAALLLGTLQLPGLINSFHSEAPKLASNTADGIYLSRAFTGVWSSESGAVDEASATNGIDPLLEGEPVKIALRTFGGEATGEIISEGLRQHHIFSRLEVEGQLRAGKIEGQVWDVIGGRKTVLATFVVEKIAHQTAELQLRVSRQHRPYLPTLSYLYRQEVPVGDEEGEFNARYFEIIRKAASH